MVQRRSVDECDAFSVNGLPDDLRPAFYKRQFIRADLSHRTPELIDGFMVFGDRKFSPEHAVMVAFNAEGSELLKLPDHGASVRIVGNAVAEEDQPVGLFCLERPQHRLEKDHVAVDI